MDYLFGLLALLGFIASLAVHIASLFQIDVAQHISFVWGLHLGIFVIAMPFLLGFRTLFDKEEYPDYLMILGLFIFFYVFINWILVGTSEITEFGWTQPRILEGKFVLIDSASHHKVVREITANEYRLFQIRGLRLVSGMWLLFYFVPLVFFLFRKKRLPVDSAT
jgi:hypothetical protein